MNETLQIIGSLVSSVGFPVVACIMLFRYIDEQSRTISAFTKSIDKLTNSVNRILSKIEPEHDHKRSDDT